MYLGVHVNREICSPISPNFNFPDSFFYRSQYHILQVRVELFHADVWSDRHEANSRFLQIRELALEGFMIRCCLWRLPETSEEMMSGRMNILRSLMRISPGKDTSIIDSSENWTRRPRNPIITPTTTPPMVSARRRLVRIHCSTCK